MGDDTYSWIFSSSSYIQYYSCFLPFFLIQNICLLFHCTKYIRESSLSFQTGSWDHKSFKYVRQPRSMRLYLMYFLIIWHHQHLSGKNWVWAPAGLEKNHSCRPVKPKRRDGCAWPHRQLSHLPKHKWSDQRMGGRACGINFLNILCMKGRVDE